MRFGCVLAVLALATACNKAPEPTAAPAPAAPAAAPASPLQAEKERGEAFAQKAATEPGSKRLPAGFVYTELTPGTGEQPTAADSVTVHYKGTLIDGAEFDSSYKRNAPASFPLRGVIKCWTEGVAMMKVGGKARLVCPSDTAYGDRGRPPRIPGGATLVFEVELLEVKKG